MEVGQGNGLTVRMVTKKITMTFHLRIVSDIKALFPRHRLNSDTNRRRHFQQTKGCRSKLSQDSLRNYVVPKKPWRPLLLVMWHPLSVFAAVWLCSASLMPSIYCVLIARS